MSTRILILVLVLLAVVGSALAVVHARHQSRHLAVQLGSLESEYDAAVAEWSRLQLEQAWLADAGQVESAARGKLSMHPPAEVNVLVVGQ